MTTRKKATAPGANDDIRHQPEAFFLEALAAARVGTWTWDIATDEIVWSREVERLFGLSPGTFDGTYASYQRFQHPDDLARVERAITHAIQSGSAYDIEHRVRRIDGSVRWVQGRGRAAYDDDGKAIRMAGTVVDITDKKRISEHAARMQFTIERASDAVFWHDRNARFIYANLKACEELGYTREELEQLSVADISTTDPWEGWDEFWQGLTERKTLKLESVHRRKDGSTFPAEVHLNYIDYGGDGFVCAFVRNISARVEADEKRKRLEAQVLHAKKLESLGVLAGGIAHDFNNLLVGILGSASLAASEVREDSSIRERLEVIQNAALRASDLATQMLAYAGKGTRHVEPLSISELVTETSRLLEHTISNKAILRLELASDPLMVRGDATQLRQVLMNLLTNASDALEGRSGSITLGTGTIDAEPGDFRDSVIATELPAGKYHFVQVEDDGSGIHQESLTKIFDPFYTTKFAGRGLGLAAVLGIVTAHEGAIQLESATGTGTRFKVFLPALTSNGVLTGAAKPKSSSASWHGQGTVLVVDDEELVRNVAALILKKHGFQVLTAADGREAIELASKSRDLSLVLLDMTMPGMDGEQTHRALRELNPGLPVVLSSGFGEQDAARRFRENPPDAYVQKPYRVGELVSAIRSVLENRRPLDD